ncbi:MAG: hypothetical protein ACN4GZ_06650 [Acidimicrobiales bacterium]
MALASPADAQALPHCVAVGEVIEGTLSAAGTCRLRRSGGTDGSEITCEYNYLFNDSDVSVYQPSPGVYSSGTDNNGSVTVTITEVIIGSTSGSSLEFETVTLEGAARQFSSTGRWYRRFCSDSDGLIAVDGPLPSGPTKSVADVIEEAAASLQPVAPDTINHSGPGSILQLATFFWLEGVDLESNPLTSQSSHGNLVVTVVAQPSEFFFEVDGQRYDCGARNTVWTRGLDENDPGACTHTFFDAPDGERAIELDLVLVHTTSWAANIGGLGGDLAPVPARTNGIVHPVFEVVGLAGDR